MLSSRTIIYAFYSSHIHGFVVICADIPCTLGVTSLLIKILGRVVFNVAKGCMLIHNDQRNNWLITVAHILSK